MPRPEKAGWLVALLFLAIPSRLPGQTDSVLPPPLVLGLPASVRSAGMGGAGVALVGDAGSVFTNPSGLATIKYVSVEGAFHYLPDALQSVGAGAARLGPFDLGVGYDYLRYRRKGSPLKDNLLWAGSAVYRVGLFALGATEKYVSMEDSSGHISRTLANDAGLTVAVFDIMALAVSVQDFNQRRLSGNPILLPTRTRFGFAFNFVDPQTTARLLATIETVWTEGEARRTVFGLETGVVLHGVGLVARVGTGAQPAGTGQRKLAVGGGIVLGRLGIDYAYQARSGGGDIHRVGVRWSP